MADAAGPRPPRDLRVVQVTPGDRPGAATARLVESALEGGVTAVVLRERALAPDELRALARRVRQATRRVGAALIVSNDVDLALEVQADGVQLGFGGGTVADARRRLREAGRSPWVLRSTHWPPDDEDRAADVLALSPFGATLRSHARPRLTPGQVAAVLEAAGARPVVALGGLTAREVGALPRELAGVAVVRALSEAADPAAAARELRAAVERRGLGASPGGRAPDPPAGAADTAGDEASR